MKAKTILFCAALAAFAACSNDVSDDVEVLSHSNEQVLEAQNGGLSATIADGLRSQWAAGDRIKLLFGELSATVEVQDSSKTVGFSSEIDFEYGEDNPLMGVFPADNVVAFNSGSITVGVPTEQSPTVNGYDKAAQVEVARTATNKSICLLKQTDTKMPNNSCCFSKRTLLLSD